MKENNFPHFVQGENIRTYKKCGHTVYTPHTKHYCRTCARKKKEAGH